jgi:hypothetical protein
VFASEGVGDSPDHPHSKTRFHVFMQPLLLSDFNRNWNVLADFSRHKSPECQILWKFFHGSPVVTRGNTDGQADMEVTNCQP